MSKLIYPQLSYQITGVLYSVYNELGYGYNEKPYQKAISFKFEKNKIKFKKELKIDLVYEGHKIAKYFLDFLVEDKIVLEIKVGKFFHKKDYQQIKSYLKVNNLELGIITLFAPDGVKIKRILNRVNS